MCFGSTSYGNLGGGPSGPTGAGRSLVRRGSLGTGGGAGRLVKRGFQATNARDAIARNPQSQRLYGVTQRITPTDVWNFSHSKDPNAPKTQINQKGAQPYRVNEARYVRAEDGSISSPVQLYDTSQSKDVPVITRRYAGAGGAANLKKLGIKPKV